MRSSVIVVSGLPGACWPYPELTPESERQLRLRVTNGCALADSFVAAGFCAPTS